MALRHEHLLSHHDAVEAQEDDFELQEKDLESQDEDLYNTTDFRWLKSSTTTSHSAVLLQSWQSLSGFAKGHVFTKAFLVSILPKYLQPGGLQDCKKHHSTAYLDAVRGYAALMVLHDHVYRWVQHPYLEIPFINLFRQGPFAVNLFFIISGYVLTRRMLSLMRQRKDSELLQCLSSAVFRRYFRLYASAVFGSFICVVLFPSRLTGYPQPGTPRSVIMLDWLSDTFAFCNPFVNLDGYPSGFSSKYLTPLWTIPVEFRGSMLSFLFCAATYRMLPRQRALTCLVLILFCYLWAFTYAAMFLFGTFLAERSLSRDEAAQQQESQMTLDTQGTRLSFPSMRPLIVSSIAVVVGCFLGSQHYDLGINGPNPWPYLDKLIPFWWPESILLRLTFWLSIGASFVLYGLDRYPKFHVPFEWSFSQYLGHLSFGIYIVHLPIDQCDWLWTARFSLRNQLGGGLWALLLDYIMFMFLVIWAADYFTRVDGWIVKSCRWMEKQTSTNS